MSALLFLVATLLGGHAHVVAYDEPTGDLVPGDIVIEHHLPNRSVCDDRGGRYVLGFCVGEDF